MWTNRFLEQISSHKKTFIVVDNNGRLRVRCVRYADQSRQYLSHMLRLGALKRLLH